MILGFVLERAHKYRVSCRMLFITWFVCRRIITFLIAQKPAGFTANSSSAELMQAVTCGKRISPDSGVLALQRFRDAGCILMTCQLARRKYDH